jgi:hypothetical protein
MNYLRTIGYKWVVSIDYYGNINNVDLTCIANTIGKIKHSSIDWRLYYSESYSEFNTSSTPYFFTSLISNLCFCVINIYYGGLLKYLSFQ